MTTAAIGPAKDHEIDALAALMRATIEPLTYYNDQARRSEIAKYDAAALRALAAGDPQAVLVARDNTRDNTRDDTGDDTDIIGFCVSRYDDGTIWLSWFGTATRARGRGVGAALLAALAQTLPSRNAHKIWCDSRTDNTESRSALERAGFRRIATLTNHWFGQDYFLWEN